MRIVEATVLLADAPEEAGGSGALLGSATRFDAARRILEALGPDALVEPVRARPGGARLRALAVAPERDAGGVLRELRDACRGREGRARLVHADACDAVALLHRVRHPLPTEEAAVLQAAYELGYYEMPRACRLADVAAHLGQSPTPVHRRMQAAERRVFGTFSDGPVTGPARDARRRRPPRGVAGPAEVTLRVAWGALASAGRGSVWIGGFTAAGDPRFLQGAEGAGAPAEAEVALQALSKTLGPEVVLRPVCVAGDRAWIRVEVPDGGRLEDVAHRVDEAGRAVGWEGAEVLGVRPGGGTVREAPPLTSRQEQVLRLAHALGYYRTPRGCSLERLADALGVTVNAVHKSLMAAENRTVARYLASQE